MITNRSEFLDANTSEKIQLVWLEASQKVVSFSTVSPGNYRKISKYWVINVLKNGAPISFTFNPDTYAVDFASADSKNITLVYRFFFANTPINLPYNLTSGGSVVPYLAMVNNISGGSSKLDSTTRIAIEGSASFSLDNDQEYFQNIYDKLSFSNQKSVLFDYHRDIPLTDKGIIFKGRVVSQSISQKAVTFQLKNFFYDLRSEIDLPNFANSQVSGTRQIAYKDNLKDKPIRRLYGRNSNMILIPSDTVGSTGYKCTNYIVTNPIVGLLNMEKDYSSPILFSGNIGEAFVTSNSINGYINRDVLADDTLIINDIKYKVATTARVLSKKLSGKVTMQYISGEIARLTFAEELDFTPTYQDTLILSDLIKSVTANQYQGAFSILSGATTLVINYAHEGTLAPGFNETFDAQDNEISISRTEDHRDNRVYLDKPLTVSFSGLQGRVIPAVPYNRVNRYYTIASHKLAQPKFIIETVVSENFIKLDSTLNLNANDLIEYNDQRVYILRVSGNFIALKGALTGLALGGEVKKVSVQKIEYGINSFEQNVDYVIENNDEKSEIKFFDGVERNFATKSDTRVNIYFATNVVISPTGGFSSLKNRDWVEIAGDAYQVIEKLNNSCCIIDGYLATTNSVIATVYASDIFKDDSVITANVLGIGLENGQEINCASAIAKHLLQNSSISDEIDENSFDTATSIFQHVLAMQIPEKIGAKTPKLSEILQDITGSVSAAVFYDKNYLVKYKQLIPDLDAVVKVIDFRDIIDISVSTNSADIVSSLDFYYNFRDYNTRTNEKELSSKISLTSANYTLNPFEKKVSVNSFVINENSAKVFANREIMQRTKAENTFNIKLSLRFADLNLFDVVAINYHKFFKTINTDDYLVLCLVNSVSSDGKTVNISVTDLGGLYQKSARIAPNDCSDFADATTEEKVKYGFITNSDSFIVNENDLDSNLIS